jgi:AAA ATPase-like protein
VSATRFRLHAAATRGLTRFVGRDTEMDQLRRALEQARQGRGQVVPVVGEPGVGKSRLVFDFTHSHRAQSWTVLTAGAVSYGTAISHLPVIELLKNYLEISDRDTQREMHEKVTAKMLAVDRALEPTLPAFLALLDVPADDPQWQVLDPPQRRRHTLEAVKRLLMRAAISLERLWHEQGKRERARALLAAVYGRFTEGFDTRDLRAARALLEQLAWDTW